MNTKHLIPILTGLMTFMVFFSCSDDENIPAELTLSEKFQKALDEGIMNYEGKGISAAVLLPDGELWKGAAGISSGTTPVTTDMYFSAGSITKVFTAATILQYSEEGLISLDDSLYHWLPPMDNIDSTVTIRQLLNHTSGIFNLTEHPNIWQVVFSNPARSFTMEEMVNDYTLGPDFEKGTNWNYSNTGYLLLRMIIKDISGTTLSSEYRNRLIDPLGLDNIYLSPEESLSGSVAQAWFDLDNNGVYEEIPFMNSFYSMAGGGIFCTPEDLAKWLDELLGEESLLSAALLNQMKDFHSPCPGEPMLKGYGLGLQNFEPDLFGNLEMWGHGGDALGYAAGCFYLVDYDVTIAIMDNTEEGESMWIINDLINVVKEHYE